MRFGRNDTAAAKQQMTSMIDIVFLLLIFFMLSLKITAQEGDFHIRTPSGTICRFNQDVLPLSFNVRLHATADGELVSLELSGQDLGAGDAALDKLNREILRLSNSLTAEQKQDAEVEIEADYNLHYSHTIRAVSACTGHVRENGEIQPLLEKIQFAPAVKPEA